MHPHSSDSLLFLAGQPTWKMPELTHVNRLTAHSPLMPFSSLEAALQSRPEASPFFRCLNGKWKFTYLAKPEEFDPAMLAPNDSDVAEIDVPGVWTRQGYGSPHYTNVQMPFPNDPPEVPEENPVGVYQRQISIPAAWVDRRTIVHFGGAESVLYVFVDGRAVGMSKDSRLPSEFDLTDFITSGATHTLTAVVVKWSDASFIEDQDQWWMGGLHRDVFLYSTAPVALWDVFARAMPADENPAQLTVTLTPRFGICAEPNFSAGFQLFDASGNSMGEAVSEQILVFSDKNPRTERISVTISSSFENIRPWTAETPVLYSLIAWLRHPDGATEFVRQDIGFRRVEIIDGELCVNGRPLMIHGVNRHEHDDVTGKAISREAMERDVQIIKAHNINAVRTSHYPNHPYFYELCNRHGLYVIDEANIECHSHSDWICRDPRYLAAFVDRVSNMVLRDKNHPSIILWSLGNESGIGSNHEAVAGWVRGFDPSRPVHYEGAISYWQSKSDWFSHNRVTDIICPMYPTHEALKTWMENPDRNPRPVIPCEYSHAMGNSNGGLADYYELFEKYRGLQGGFIWEFVDHGLRAETDEGEIYWKYGGDFGDTPNDANFVCDGLLGPDRVPHPGLFEFKHLARPVSATLVTSDGSGATLRIKNRRLFADLSDLEASWTLRLDGRPIDSGRIETVSAEAGAEVDVRIAFGNSLPAEGEIHLDVTFCLRDATALLPAGHPVGTDQLTVRHPVQSAPASAMPPVRVETAPESLASDQLAASLADGQIHQLSFDGKPLLSAPIELHLFRAATDNDGLILMPQQAEKPLSQWLAAGLDQLRRSSVSVAGDATNSEAMVVSEEWSGSRFIAEHTARYSVEGDALISEHWVKLADDTPELPRVGISLALAPGFESVEYFGRGPWENYLDRKASAHLGVYQSTVSKEYVPYVMPQENGHHTDCRWVRLTNADGLTIEVDGCGAPFGFAARHHSDSDLFSARHTPDLPKRAETFLYLDHVHTGLGTGSCGPGRLEKHQILAKDFAFKFRIRLVRAEDNV